MPNHQDNYELYHTIILQIWNISLTTITHKIMHLVAISFQIYPSDILSGRDSRWRKKTGGEKKAEFFYETQKIEVKKTPTFS